MIHSRVVHGDVATDGHSLAHVVGITDAIDLQTSNTEPEAKHRAKTTASEDRRLGEQRLNDSDFQGILCPGFLRKLRRLA